MELKEAIIILDFELAGAEDKGIYSPFYMAIYKVLDELEKLKKSNKPDKVEKIIFDNDLKK